MPDDNSYDSTNQTELNPSDLRRSYSTLRSPAAAPVGEAFMYS